MSVILAGRRDREDDEVIFLALLAQADEAYRLGPPPSRESYLRGEAIVEIARKTGAQVGVPFAPF